MRQLILMRHGKAEAAPAHDDHARPLSPRGRAEAAEAGRRLAALAQPDLALVSDGVRTRDTFDAVAPAFATELPHRLSRGLYGATADAILAAVRTAPDDVGSLLVVGHNPGVGDLARRLARDGAAEDLASLAEGFPTSCFAVLEFDAATWAAADRAGRLAFLLPPGDRSGS